MNLSRIVRCAATAVASPLMLTAAQAQSPVTFCAGSHNLPMSQRGEPGGFEVEIARALAEELGAEARFEWLETHAESFEQAVLDDRCDVALGAITDPGPMVGEGRLPGVRYTSPYYRTGYLLLRRAETKPARSLDRLMATRIAVEKESIVAFTLRQRGHRVHVMPTAQAVVRAIAEGRADYGYLWGPLAAWLVRNRSDVLLEPEITQADRWTFALALRDRDRELYRRLNRAVASRLADGTVAGILRAYGLPEPREPEPSDPAATPDDTKPAPT